MTNGCDLAELPQPLLGRFFPWRECRGSVVKPLDHLTHHRLDLLRRIVDNVESERINLGGLPPARCTNMLKNLGHREQAARLTGPEEFWNKQVVIVCCLLTDFQ